MSKRPAPPDAQGSNKRAASSASDIVFRVLVPERRVGLVIGTRGSNIKRLRDSTGARVQVVEPVTGCDERVIIISAKPDAVNREGVSPAQAALVLLGVQEAGESGQDTPTIRLLVVKSHAGLLIGRHGATIRQLNNETGAQLNVLPEAEVPCCALSNDRVLQVVGSDDAMQRALKAVAEKLQAHPPRDGPGEPRLDAIKQAAAAAAG